MRYLPSLCCLGLLVFAMSSCTPANNTAGKGNPEAAKLFEDYYNERLSYYPLEATSNGDTRYNDKLPVDIADSYREQLKGFYRKYKDALARIDTSKLNRNDKMSCAILHWEVETNLEGLSFHQNYIPVNQFDCLTLTMAQLGSGDGNQPFKTVVDYDNWLKRMQVFPAWCDTAIANMRKGMATGWVLPKALTSKVLPQIEKIISADASKSIFFQPIAKLPAATSAADKQRLTDAYTHAITDWINPAYQRLHDFMAGEYMAKCRNSSGIGDCPGGDQYYKWLIKSWTTTTMSPDEIFALGQQEVARIRQEMEAVKATVGFKGELSAFFTEVNNAPVLHPYTKASQAIDQFKNIHAKLQPAVKRLFDVEPKTPFEIRETEAFREATASAEYLQGSADGTRPGIFYCPVPDPPKYNVFQDEALFLHEAIPGHHYQISLQQENTELPKFRRFLWYGAYGEGWALYTESLGKELGLYTDPYQYFGKLGMEMHRAIRLVIDIGMHNKGWTREQAIRYSLDNEAETEANTIAEVERYMANPGQALSYKIGQLKIAQLRQQQTQKQGNAFDIRKFHHTVLAYGCLPLAVLEANIE